MSNSAVRGSRIVEPTKAKVRLPSHWRELARSPALVVWLLFLLMIPFYVLPSGLPQPNSWLVFLLVPLSLLSWNGKLDRETVRLARPLLLFTLWVFVVNAAWALIMWKWDDWKDFLIVPFFYVFNTAIFLVAQILARRNREAFLRLTTEAVFLTVVILLVSSFFYRSDYYRGQVFFNSPNQLGYYALLAACLFSMVQRPLGISRFRVAVAVTFCAYLAVLSASRAAVAGILVLLVVLVFSNPRTMIIACLAAVALVGVGGPIATALEVSETRVEHGRDDRFKGGFSEERGYDRIVNFPEYLITGAGEGGYERFVRPGEKRRELHSSFGTVVFSYGVIGLTMFVVFGYRVVRRAPLRMSLMFVPALMFTLAHQGLRFTMFWVLLGMFVVLKNHVAQEPSDRAARIPIRS